MSKCRFTILGTGLLIGLAGFIAMRAALAAAPSSDHYLAHESTDKPIYRLGERVYVRTVLLGADSRRPIAPDRVPIAQVTVNGPRGQIVASGQTTVQDSVAAYTWDIPETMLGGEYTVTTSFPTAGYPPAVRKFDVRAYRVPRLKGEIIFLHDGVGAGDPVRASLHVERAEGGIPAGAAVTSAAIVDGEPIYNGATTIDAQGNCSVEFKLPPAIEKGDGTLSLTIADGGVVESIAKTIPILINNVDVAIYPEGGDLVAGVNCRVYVEGRTPSKKPADLTGAVVDATGKEVAILKTDHEGRGRFAFIPLLGQTYSIKLSQPAGIKKAFVLPDVKDAGVSLQSDDLVAEKGQPIRLHLAACRAGDFNVTISKRDVELVSHAIALTAGQSAGVSIDLPDWADGVLVATVRDAHGGTPLAERLVFRRPSKSLHVKVTPDQTSYVPAGSAKLTVTTTDGDGHPVAATVGITVSDDSIPQMLEKRDRPPRLDAMVFLEDDVKELADADVYLDGTDAASARDLDLLLGTQGWRRFALRDTAKFIATAGDQARRVLAELSPIPQLALSGAAFGGGAVAGRGGRGGRGGGAVRGAGAVNGPADESAVRGAVLGPNADDQLGVNRDRAVFDGIAVDKALAPAAPVAAAMPVAPGAQVVGGGGGGRRGIAMSRLLAAQQAAQQFDRVYAHDVAPDRDPNQRFDFTETIYWAAGVKTDATGMATVSFKMNDAVTSFKASADAFSDNGALGTGTAMLHSVQPFYVEPKLPLEVSAGDIIRLPVATVNQSGQLIKGASVAVFASDGMEATAIDPFDIGAGERARHISTITVGPTPRSAKLLVKAQAGTYSDEVTRTFNVMARGFPTDLAKGGTIDANASVETRFVIPESLVKGSMSATVALYPTPVGNLTDALEGLLREPNGCFEQTSSTNYPLVMADQYFSTHTGVDPALIARTNDLLDKGYARLVSFECQNKGYEWFGQDPGHECLSAYGLLEFTDMSQVRQVDPEMMRNTRNWLLAHRDGHGGFTHERRALHTWLADPGCANGYCTWALLECGEKNLDMEVNWLKQEAATDPNTYVTALAANVLSLAGDRDGAKMFLDKLVKLQDADGKLRGATTSVVGSGGEALAIETTSLATLAWLRDPAYGAPVASAMRFIADSCRGGRFGSTQATVLALRAIVANDKAHAHPTAAGAIQLLFDGQAAGDAIKFDENSKGAIRLPDISEHLTPGTHTIMLHMTDGGSLPFAMNVSFNSTTPASADQCKIDLATSLASAIVREGDTTVVNVTVINKSNATVPTPIAIIGLPGGLEVRHDQLKELVKSDRIAAYEVRGREVILYWRDLQAGEKVQIPISVTAAVPGEYTGPASRAYLYYTDEFKQWVAGMKVTIQ